MAGKSTGLGDRLIVTHVSPVEEDVVGAVHRAIPLVCALLNLAIAMDSAACCSSSTSAV